MREKQKEIEGWGGAEEAEEARASSEALKRLLRDVHNAHRNAN